MAMSRSFGGTLLTTRSPMRISPAVMFSRPAIIRSKVDLPQPYGPTRTTNAVADADVDAVKHLNRAKRLAHASNQNRRHMFLPIGPSGSALLAAPRQPVIRGGRRQRATS
jgi:hypothetical protein